MSALNKFMTRGFISPQAHGVLDYPLAAVLIAGRPAIDFDYKAVTVIALAFGGIAVATLATRFESTSSMPARRAMMSPEAA